MEYKKGRPPKARAGSASMHITVRVTEEMLADIDSARGTQPRSDWVRALVAERLTQDLGAEVLLDLDEELLDQVDAEIATMNEQRAKPMSRNDWFIHIAEQSLRLPHVQAPETTETPSKSPSSRKPAMSAPSKKKQASVSEALADHRHQWVGALGRKHCRVCGITP